MYAYYIREAENATYAKTYARVSSSKRNFKQETRILFQLLDWDDEENHLIE